MGGVRRKPLAFHLEVAIEYVIVNFPKEEIHEK
jgi:hypothetical protein